MKHLSPFSSDVSPARLVSFSDGVFAIAITLLVFNLKVPDIPAAQAHNLLPQALRAMLPSMFTFVVTFLLVGLYWTVHHRMLNLVVHVDNTFIWMNILYLLSISFLPFPSALWGAYPEEMSSLILYFSSMILVGILSLAMWWYASYDHRLINKEVPALLIRYYFLRSLSSLVVFSITILLVIFHVSWAMYCLFLIFPMRRIMKRFVSSGEKSEALALPQTES
jgi:uncharacterized membrane protein